MDVGDKVQVKERKTKLQLVREKETEELRIILSTYIGRAFYWRLLSKCGVYKCSFNGDPNVTIFNEGQRNIGLWALEALLLVGSEVYTLMRNEASERGKI